MSLTLPKTIGQVAAWITTVAAAAVVLWVIFSFAITYADRGIAQSLDAIRLEQEVQSCQRLKRAEGIDFALAQMTCDHEIRIQEN